MNGIAISPVQPMGWRPTLSPMPVGLRGGWRPAPLPAGPGNNEFLGVNIPPEIVNSLGQGGSLKAAAAGVVLVPTALAALTSFVGFRLGTKDEGFPSFLGYALGALGAISALVGLLMVVGIVALPSLPEAAAPAAPAPGPAPTPRRGQEITAEGPLNVA